jgi:hypothetical protein
LKSGSLKLLEPSGPLQDCNGIAILLKHNGDVTPENFVRPFLEPLNIKVQDRGENRISKRKLRNRMSKYFSQKILKVGKLSCNK